MRSQGRRWVSFCGASALCGLGMFSWAAASTTQDVSTAVVDVVRLIAPNDAPRSLAEIANGKPVAMIVMKGPWCPVCIEQVNRLVQRSGEVQRSGGRVVVLTDLGAEENRALAKEHGWTFMVYGDPSHRLLAEHGLWREGAPIVYPGLIFLDKCGEVAFVGRGRRPGQIQDPVVLKTLRSLSARHAGCGVFT